MESGLHGSGTPSATCSFLASFAFFSRAPFTLPSLKQVDSAVRGPWGGSEWVCGRHIAWLNQPCTQAYCLCTPFFWNGSHSSYMTYGLNLGIRFGDVWMICLGTLFFLHKFNTLCIPPYKTIKSSYTEYDERKRQWLRTGLDIDFRVPSTELLWLVLLLLEAVPQGLFFDGWIRIFVTSLLPQQFLLNEISFMFLFRDSWDLGESSSSLTIVSQFSCNTKCQGSSWSPKRCLQKPARGPKMARMAWGPKLPVGNTNCLEWKTETKPEFQKLPDSMTDLNCVTFWGSDTDPHRPRHGSSSHDWRCRRWRCGLWGSDRPGPSRNPAGVCQGLAALDL